jgi:septum formation protein
MTFILASSSPRRISLLKQAGYDFRIIASNVEEDFPNSIPVDEVPVYIARKKAIAVYQQQQASGIPVLAADTVVILDGEIIGKPESEEQAISMLEKLSGKMHRVITGVFLLHEENAFFFQDETRVWFRQLQPDQIMYYVQHFKPFDKAGAYAIQEWIGLVGITRIEGNYFNVMGLPVHKVMDLLQSVGIFPSYVEKSTTGNST